MPWVSTCQTTTFSYDADGQRILTSRPNDTLVYTPFPDYEREVTDGGAVTERTTYSIAGQMVGVRVKVSGGSNTLYYTYTDHLGSVVAMSNTAGGVVSGSLARYDPFGNYRTWPGSNVNPLISDRGFTGHVHDNTGVYPTENVGLIYMNARYYLPEVGRFISADTIVLGPGNPQSFDRRRISSALWLSAMKFGTDSGNLRGLHDNAKPVVLFGRLALFSTLGFGLP